MSENHKPLTFLEQFFIDCNPYMPTPELARVLGRPESDLAGHVPERVPQFERMLQPIKRDGNTVGTVWNPAASAAMDDNRDNPQPDRPASSDVPAPSGQCSHSPLGDRRKAQAVKLGRPVHSIATDAPRRDERQ
jgi:hypothetical protein